MWFLDLPAFLPRQRLLSDKGFAGSFPQPGDAKQREALPPGEGASPGQNAPKAKARRKAKKGKGGEEGAGDHQDENPVVKHNKKVSSKITSLSTKLTEVRCIMTQVQSANMCQWLISHFLLVSHGNKLIFGYLDLNFTHHMVNSIGPDHLKSMVWDCTQHVRRHC